MQITCPSCHTTFITDAKEVSEQGRKVKCSQCQYIWWHYADVSTISPIAQPINPNTELYGFKKQWPKFLYFLLPLLFLASIISGYYIYHFVYHDSEELILKITDPTITRTPHTTEVSWRLTNQSKQLQSLPLLNVTLLDDQDFIVKSHIINEHLLLPAGQILAIRVVFLTGDFSPDKIALYKGSRLEFLSP